VSSPDPRYDVMDPILPSDMEPLVDVTARTSEYLDVISRVIAATQHKPSLQANLLTILNDYQGE
jgi:hypothetical protein